MSQRRALTFEELLQQENNLSDELLDQRIPKEKLFDIAGLLPNWYDYAGTPGLGLTDGEKLTIRQDVFLSMNRLKAHRALEIWYDRNPYIATYRFILELCLQRQHGDVAINIVRELLLECEEVDHPVAAPVPHEPGPGLYEHVDQSDTIQPPLHPSKFDETALTEKSQEVLQREFAVLFSCLRRALLEKRIAGSDLMSHLQSLDFYAGPIQPLYRNRNLSFDSAARVVTDLNLDHVFHLMTPYCSWFNHLLVKSIIDVYFADDKDNMVHKVFDAFETKFKQYCRERHVVVGDYGSDEVEGTTLTIFKIDKSYDNIRVEYLPDIVEKLANALGGVKNLVLRTVRNGCLELGIAMPTHTADQLFHLEEDTLRALQKCRIIRYVQGGRVCDIVGALKRIEQSKQKSQPQIQDTARGYPYVQGHIEHLQPTYEMSTALVVPTSDRRLQLIANQLRNIGDHIEQPYFSEPPREMFVYQYGGQMLVGLGILLPNLSVVLNMFNFGMYKVVFPLSGIGLALGWQYYRWRKYPFSVPLTINLIGDVSRIIVVGAIGCTMVLKAVKPEYIITGYAVFMLGEISGISSRFMSNLLTFLTFLYFRYSSA